MNLKTTLQLLILFTIFLWANSKNLTVSDCDDLFGENFILNEANVNYILKRDIHCEEEYPPIGYRNNIFKGTLDLNGFQIFVSINPPTSTGSIFYEGEFFFCF